MVLAPNDYPARVERENLPFPRGSHCLLREVITAWQDDAGFRAFFITELAATPYPAFFWEMPPIRRGQTDVGYEYVAIRSDALARMPADTEAFAAQFRATPDAVVSFRNLGGDALLVAPRSIGKPQLYGNLAAFLRAAPAQQQHELLQVLGRAIDQELRRTAERIWISTSGLGVAWLHIRLDSYPKYYQHRPTRRRS
ncbi:MAG: DUF6940 family protein [Rhizomicrobium sp.]